MGECLAGKGTAIMTQKPGSKGRAIALFLLVLVFWLGTVTRQYFGLHSARERRSHRVRSFHKLYVDSVCFCHMEIVLRIPSW